MEWLTHILWYHDKFLGIEWSGWKIVGWAGNAVFSSRVVLQWYATEKHKQVVVPVLFWWLSLIGSLLLLCYALFGKHDSVFIYAYALNWIPYIPRPSSASTAENPSCPRHWRRSVNKPCAPRVKGILNPTLFTKNMGVRA